MGKGEWQIANQTNPKQVHRRGASSRTRPIATCQALERDTNLGGNATDVIG